MKTNLLINSILEERYNKIQRGEYVSNQESIYFLDEGILSFAGDVWTGTKNVVKKIIPWLDDAGKNLPTPRTTPVGVDPADVAKVDLTPEELDKLDAAVRQQTADAIAGNPPRTTTSSTPAKPTAEAPSTAPPKASSADDTIRVADDFDDARNRSSSDYYRKLKEIDDEAAEQAAKLAKKEADDLARASRQASRDMFKRNIISGIFGAGFGTGKHSTQASWFEGRGGAGGAAGDARTTRIGLGPNSVGGKIA